MNSAMPFRAITAPDVSLKYPDLAYLRLTASMPGAAPATFNASGSYGSGRAWEQTARSSCVPVVVAPFGCSLDMARMPARPCRRAVQMCQRQSSRGRKRLRACKLPLDLGGACPTSMKRSRPGPQESTAGPISGSVGRSKR